MSALPPKADMSPTRIRPCPLWANSGHSAIHLITSSARRRNASGIVNPSAFAVFRLNNEIELGRLLDRKVGRLGPAQNFIGIVAGTPKQSGMFGP